MGVAGCAGVSVGFDGASASAGAGAGVGTLAVTTGVGAGAGIGAGGAETTETLSPAGPAGAGDASESLDIGGAGTPFCAASTVRLKGVSETVVRPSDTLITMSE